MADYDTFTGVTHIGYAGYMENLSENFAAYLDWAFLNVGGFDTARIGQTRYGQDPTVLRQVSSTVYESFKKNWVWESGIYYQTQPLQISGVYINGSFYTPVQTGFQINYRDGQILFDSPQSGTIQVEYSYKLYSVYQLHKDRWFDDVLTGEWAPTYTDYNQVGSGAFNILAENRVTTPFVAVEVVPRRTFKPLQLGGGQIVYQDIQFWIVSTEPWQVQTATDAISLQNDKTFRLFNTTFVQNAHRWPYEYDGTLNPSGLIYKDLVDNYFWKKVRSNNTTINKIAGAPLYINTVRMVLEGDFEDI